jgi:sulfotransferase
MKKIYFISGFPRSGNTLLAALLSQNPKICATGHSYLPDITHSLESIRHTSVAFKNFPDDSGLEDILKNVFLNFYQSIDKDVIIERGDWITPFNFSSLLKYCPNEIKIVVLVRDILDIIKSYLKICETYPTFYLNTMYNDIDKTTLYQSEMAVKADIVMTKEGYVDSMLYSINFLIKNNYLQCVKFVEYNELIADPHNTLKEIYQFYGIDWFNHSYQNLDQLSVNNISYNDDILGAPIHTIDIAEIKQQNNPISLENSIIRKYSGLEFWRKL